MSRFTPRTQVLFAIAAMSACAADNIYPTEANIKTIIVQKYQNDSNANYFSDGKVEALQCTHVQKTVVCDFDYWSIHHKFTLNKVAGNWTLIDGY